MPRIRPPRTDGQLISFQPSKCEDECIIIDSNPLCDSNPQYDPIKNRNFLTSGSTIIDWTKVNLDYVSSSPLVVSFSAGFTVGSLTQSGRFDPGCYRVYYSAQITNGFGWGMDFSVTPDGTVNTLFSGSTEDIESGYVDIVISGATPKTLELIINGNADTDEFQLNYLFICQQPHFDPSKRHGFQLPMINCDGVNMLDNDGNKLGMVAPSTATHSGDSTFSEDDATTGTYEDRWDDDHQPYNIGYDGSLFFKYVIDSGSIAWGLDLNDERKQLTLEYYNGVSGAHPTGFNHYHDFDPLTELTGCFKSTENVGDPVVVTHGEVWVHGKTEEDTSTDPSRFKLESTLTDIDTEMFEMKRSVPITLADDTLYNIKFQLVNTTSVTVSVLDDNGATVFQAVSNPLEFDKTFNTGTLPAVKDCTIVFDFFDVIDCEASDFYEEMINQLDMRLMSGWTTAWLEEYTPVNGAFISYLEQEHYTTPEQVGDSYHDYIFYWIDLTHVEPGCYKVRLIGCADDCYVTYASQCLKVCGEAKGLHYLSWKHENIKCIGSGILDYANYGTTDPFDRHLWIRLDLQDLTQENSRVAYQRSNGFVTIPYSTLQSTEILQMFVMPEYARRAIGLMMMDSFYIDGVEYQKIDDDAFTPLFNASPNSPMRVTVRRVGDFVLSENNI